MTECKDCPENRKLIANLGGLVEKLTDELKEWIDHSKTLATQMMQSILEMEKRHQEERRELYTRIQGWTPEHLANPEHPPAPDRLEDDPKAIVSQLGLHQNSHGQGWFLPGIDICFDQPLEALVWLREQKAQLKETFDA